MTLPSVFTRAISVESRDAAGIWMAAEGFL